MNSLSGEQIIPLILQASSLFPGISICKYLNKLTISFEILQKLVVIFIITIKKTYIINSIITHLL